METLLCPEDDVPTISTPDIEHAVNRPLLVPGAVIDAFHEVASVEAYDLFRWRPHGAGLARVELVPSGGPIAIDRQCLSSHDVSPSKREILVE